MRRGLLRTGQVFAMLATAGLLGAHVVQWDRVRVDAVTLALLGLLLVIPLAELIRKVKIGDFEAEIGREEVAKAQAKAAVELPPTEADGTTISEQRIQQLLRDDPRLALAKVRIDLEEALKRLYASAHPDPDPRRVSLSRMVDGLVRREVLSGSVASALRDVIGLANRAVHGEYVESQAAEELAKLGLRLVSELQQTYVQRVLKPLESVVIQSAEVDGYSAARYRVTTIVPLVDKPTRNTYIFDQLAMNSFLENYKEYAEFIVAVERL